MRRVIASLLLRRTGADGWLARLHQRVQRKLPRGPLRGGGCIVRAGVCLS